MTAINRVDSEVTYSGKSLKDIYSKMCRDLSVSGPRAIQVETKDGSKIRASLFDGDSFIKSSNGRVIYSS